MLRLKLFGRVLTDFPIEPHHLHFIRKSPSQTPQTELYISVH